MRLRHALWLTLTLLATPSGADDRAGEIPFRESTLDNGLRVITVEDFSCPIVAVQVWYHVGSKDEDPQRQGFAHMFEHMMFRGTDRLGPTDHFDLIRRTGGNCNAYTSFDQTVYVQKLPAHQVELALWLESERMAFLKIDQTSFDTERKVVEEERRLGLNRPYGGMFEKLFAELFKQHPYRWTPIGNIPHLRAASVQELRDFWTRYYVPNNATLVIVGAVKHDDGHALAKKYFGWIPRYPDPPRITVREPLPTESRTVTFKEDNAPAPLLGVVFRGVPVGHADYYPLQMLAAILGGGASSRLYRELVADKQLAVVAAGAAFSLEQDGLVAFGAAMSPIGAKPARVQEAILAQLERARSEPVTDRELEKARNQLLTQVVSGALTVESKAQAIGSAAVLEGSAANVNRRIAAIRAVTADDVLRVAKTYLAPERAMIGRINSNLLGTLFGRKKSAEDEAPITATPETDAPAPGRAGLTRPPGFPTTAPVAALGKSEVAMGVQEKTLPNGLRVMVVENHEVPYVSVQLGLRHGAASEQKRGAASLAAGMLVKGTEKHSEAEMAEELEFYGISLSGSADMDTASVTAACVSDHIERAVELMAEAVLTPTFPPKELEKLRKQVLTGLTVQSREPSYLADREFARRLYGQHPYAETATGEIADVRGVQTEDLVTWWKTFARPDHAVLIFSGDITFDRAISLAESRFGTWKADGPPPGIEAAALPPRGDTHIYLVDHPGIQSQIRVGTLGMTRHDPDYFLSRVVSQYFGGAFNARLNETIRVKKGLTYGARGGWSAQRSAGAFQISTFSKTESTVEAVRAIFDEIERLRAEPPSAVELDSTKSYTLGSFAGDRETPQAVAADVWLLASQDLPADYFEKLLAAVAAATPEQCIELARKHVDPKRMVVVVVGPAALEKELEAIAPVTVVRPKEETPPEGATVEPEGG